VVEIHLRPHIVLIQAFLVQDLSEQDAELVGGVEKNFVAMVLGKRELGVGPPVISDLQHAVGHFLRDVFLVRSLISSFTSGGNGWSGPDASGLPFGGISGRPAALRTRRVNSLIRSMRPIRGGRDLYFLLG
jgi:hypothetical protein